MPDQTRMTDEELLDELAVEDDPDELIRLRALAAQRGLYSGARGMDGRERQRRKDEGPEYGR